MLLRAGLCSQVGRELFDVGASDSFGLRQSFALFLYQFILSPVIEGTIGRRIYLYRRGGVDRLGPVGFQQVRILRNFGT